MKLLISLLLSVNLHLLALDLLMKGAGASSAPQGAPAGSPHLEARLNPAAPAQNRPAAPTSRTREILSPQAASTVKEAATVAGHSRLPLDIYYPRRELTRQPHLVSNVDLSPVASLEQGRSGSLVVELYLNEQGSIDKLDSAPGDLSMAGFQKLRELLLQLQFSGGEIDGKPVKTRLKIEVMFLPGRAGNSGAPPARN